MTQCCFRGKEQAGAGFDRFATTYESVHARNVRITGESSDYFAAYKASYIARKLARTSCQVLDYGCGIGLLARHLMGQIRAKQIDGFDPSVASLDRVDKALLSQGVFTSDPAKLRSDYEVIVLANVLHHVKPADRQDLICRLAARLACDGKLFIFEHNPANPLTCWAVGRCPFDEDAILLPPAEAAGYFLSGELHLAERDYIVFFPRWLAALRPFEASLRWCPLGAQYVLVAVKQTKA
jgi:SAM-dependent methyltransferase